MEAFPGVLRTPWFALTEASAIMRNNQPDLPLLKHPTTSNSESHKCGNAARLFLIDPSGSRLPT